MSVQEQDTAQTQGGNPNVGDNGPDKPAVPGAAPTPHAKPEAQPTGNGSTLLVTDLTATSDHPTRNHEVIVDGRVQKLVFQMGERMTLPFLTAIKFSQNPGFLVENMDYSLFQAPPSDVDERDETPKIELGDDEVIARFDELIKGALVLRAQMLPGGEEITDRTGKDNVIEFLKRERLATKKANSVSDGDMSQDDLDNLFEGHTDDDE